MVRTPPRRTRALFAALALVGAAACSSDDDSSSTGDRNDSGDTAATLVEVKDELMPKLATEVGEGEGEVGILARAGYAEAGVNDPDVDWVSDFEEETGCKANVTEFRTSDEAAELAERGGWDVVSAPGELGLRFVAGRKVVPVNTDLVPNYGDVFAYLKARPWNSVDGQMFGIPNGWGASVLLARTDIVVPAPSGLGAVFDPESPYRGKITAADSPMNIADAALHLMAAQPDLGIEDPYALDEEQFDAAVALLRDQRPLVGDYWSDPAGAILAFTTGAAVLGTAPQGVAEELNSADPPVPIAAAATAVGATGWSDTWMVAADAQHPNCAYMWIDWIVSPDTNAQVAEWVRAAPANEAACELTTDADHCATYRATDRPYADAVHFRTSPTATCLDGRTEVVCKDADAWSQAWVDITG